MIVSHGPFQRIKLGAKAKQVHILDDWFGTLHSLPRFKKLSSHDVTVWTDLVSDSEELARRSQDAEVVVFFWERTAITRELLEKLPKLRLISQRSVYPHVDVDACYVHIVLLCSTIGHLLATFAL